MEQEKKNSGQSDHGVPPLSPEERTHLEEFLVTVYDFDVSFVKTLTDDQVRKLVQKKQKEKILSKKNPNSFWIIKGLPTPELPAATGPTRHGLYIFLGFVAFFVILIVVLLVVLLV